MLGLARNTHRDRTGTVCPTVNCQSNAAVRLFEPLIGCLLQATTVKRIWGTYEEEHREPWLLL